MCYVEQVRYDLILAILLQHLHQFFITLYLGVRRGNIKAVNYKGAVL